VKWGSVVILRSDNFAQRMSQMAQNATFEDVQLMSAKP
jgi:hypothetical protein